MHARSLSMASARSTERLPDVARRARPHARAVRGRSIGSTKVKALPESLGQCKLLETLCVPPSPCAASRVCGGGGAALLPRALPHLALGHTAWPSPARAWLARAARPARGTGWGRSRPAAAARFARRHAIRSELAALPAAVDWPKLKRL